MQRPPYKPTVPTDVHIKPGFGQPHEDSSNCWCKPQLVGGAAAPSRPQIWHHQGKR